MISQFYLEKMSYQTTDTIALSTVTGMNVFHTNRWKRCGKRTGTDFYQLKLLTQTGTYDLEMIETMFSPWNKNDIARDFNLFIQNKSQTTFVYKEGKGFVWFFLILSLIGIFVLDVFIVASQNFIKTGN